MLPKSAMKALPKKLLSHMRLTIVTPKSAGLALAVVILSVTAVQADTTYQYTGNPFQLTEGEYTTLDFVSAMVTLASPLGANLSEFEVTPLAFSLSDGVQTLSNLNAPFASFFFSTDQLGLITEWSVVAQNFTSAIGTNKNLFSPLGFPTADLGLTTTGEGRVEDSPGTWATAAVPDGGTSLALLSLSLTALGVAARKFKWAAA